jgi:transcriptional regulator GlxA family with amidase domain
MARQRMLRTTNLSMTDIGYAVGYQGSNHLAEVFKATEGMTRAPTAVSTAAPEA